ncbi:MAG: hypothetical protein IT193_01795 [Propionibacteriaceae bacterium]|nr:hypothetical protein [Propionibacteriaceae bacterium]
MRREILARLFTQVVWALSASAAVFLPGVSTDITRPADLTNRPPGRR